MIRLSFYYYYYFLSFLLVRFKIIGRFVVGERDPSRPACRARREGSACLLPSAAYCNKTGFFGPPPAVVPGNTGNPLVSPSQMLLHLCLQDFGLGAEGLRHHRSCAEQTEVINTAPHASFTLLLFSPCRYPLRRGSSFTFLTPGPHWDFTLVSKPLVVFVFLMLLREVCLLRIWRRLLSRRRCWVHKRWPVLKLIFVSGLS